MSDANHPSMNYQESREFEEVVSALISYHEQHFPEIAQSLNKPATDEELDELERVIQAKLPEEFRALYKVANGQQSTNRPLFHRGYEFMPIAYVIDTWKMMKELYDSEPLFREEAENSQGAVRDLWWHPRWIPFGYMISGDHYCLDLYPSESGMEGQIIEFIHDDIPRRHLGWSINDFLGEYELGLREGRYFMHEEWSVIEPVDES
jgi:cell wall assembly regulator SMI1